MPTCTVAAPDASQLAASKPSTSTARHQPQAANQINEPGPSTVPHWAAPHESDGGGKASRLRAGIAVHAAQRQQPCRSGNALQPQIDPCTEMHSLQQPCQPGDAPQQSSRHDGLPALPQQHRQCSQGHDAPSSHRRPLAALNSNALSSCESPAEAPEPSGRGLKAPTACGSSGPQMLNQRSKVQSGGAAITKLHAKPLSGAPQPAAAADVAIVPAEGKIASAEGPRKPVRSIADVLGKRRRNKTKISSAITFDSKKGRTARITDFMPAPAPAPRHILPEAQVIECHSVCAHSASIVVIY